MNINEMNISKNNNPADALISRSLRTGIVYPSTFSPNFIMLFNVHSFFCSYVLRIAIRASYIYVLSFLLYITDGRGFLLCFCGERLIRRLIILFISKDYRAIVLSLCLVTLFLYFQVKVKHYLLDISFRLHVERLRLCILPSQLIFHQFLSSSHF